MNIQTALDSQLSRFESQLALLSSALLRNDPNELVAASAELQSMGVLFSKVIQPVAASIKSNSSAQWRVKKIVVGLDALRQGILRNSVNVDRALATLMPSCQENTYSPKANAYSRHPYGSAGRQSGEFKSMSA
jgi:hypothetical protein